jgi:F-type H+-transporting ATPase subunit epsilon
MVMDIQLKVISPERIEFDGNVQSVLVPGVLGQFEILRNHAPIVSALGKGDVVYDDGEKHTVAISGGFVSVNNNVVNVCVEL